MANYLQGLFKPQNPQKYIGDVNQIVFRSSWELRAFKWADTTDSILEWSSEPFPIKYFDSSTNKVRRYFPDLFLRVRNRNGGVDKYLVEIKPDKQTRPPKKGRKKTQTYLNEVATYEKNQSKWNQATQFCKSNNMKFRVVTEKELGI